jgi:hypothetical protein
LLWIITWQKGRKERIKPCRKTRLRSITKNCTIVSTEFEEDSVLQTLALLKQAIGEAIALKEEKRIFNEPNYILAKAADQSSFFTSAITSATAADAIVDLLSKMDFPYNLDPQNTVLYLHPSVYFYLPEIGSSPHDGCIWPQCHHRHR